MHLATSKQVCISDIGIVWGTLYSVENIQYVTCMTRKLKALMMQPVNNNIRKLYCILNYCGSPLMFHAVAESVCSQQKAPLYTQNIVPFILLQLGIIVCQACSLWNIYLQKNIRI